VNQQASEMAKNVVAPSLSCQYKEYWVDRPGEGWGDRIILAKSPKHAIQEFELCDSGDRYFLKDILSSAGADASWVVHRVKTTETEWNADDWGFVKIGSPRYYKST